MIVSRFPYPLEKGDKLRAFYQLQELSAFFDVTLIAIEENEVSETHMEIVSKYCKELIICHQSSIRKYWNTLLSFLGNRPFQIGYFYNALANKTIKQTIQSNDFKHIYNQLIRTSEYTKNIHHIPKTIDYMDALSIGIERRIEKQAFYRKWIFRMEAKRLKVYESRMFDFFEERTIISEQDRSLIHHPDRNKIHCIPNGIHPSFLEEIDQEITHELVFVGNMSYPPNVEAVIYIHDNLLPLLPNCKLLISGSSPSTKVKKLIDGNHRIELTGWVDDIRSSYRRGQIFVAPMMIGTGMQNKLLEAMALGVPCITTALANNAINAKDNEEIIVANTAKEFKQAVERLLTDQELANFIAKNARKLIEENYSWKTATRTLIELIDRNS